MTRVPELRFVGFAGEWEEKKLSEISILNPKSDSLPEIFNYVDLSSVNGTKLIESRKINKIDAPSRAQRYAKKGDIFYQTVRPYQRNNYFFDLNDDDYVFSTGYAQIRARYNAYYLFSQMQTNKFVDSILNRCTGTSFPAISTSDLSDMKLLISTSEEEQEKIGDLFSKIDQLIESQQELVDQTMAFKKSMLQKMFPKKDSLVPEFRFDKFKDNWMPIQLSKIGKTVTGNTPSTKNNLYWNDKPDNIWVTPTDIDGPTIYNSERYLTELGLEKSRYLPENSVLITSIASIGKNTINIVPVSINQQINAIIPSNHNSYFILQAMNNSKNRFESLAGNSATKIINKSTFDRFEIIVPCLEEQEKIGNFFKKLDEKIAREEKLLDAYKDMKKSLLQKMFV
ncbi:restriction endonuclease subunit S [Anaerococcus sp.]|uniref:restriction endonuclease subunit S n=1 Tax=Anaerococcus sp. TaxID=1872515 RepID=UPI00280C38F1|nr:restriction endonuclease subunit S [Anaerococcus sp.]MDU3177159.1 restriction endonuclease subunit S [Anaerococcus sp.]